MTIPTKFMDREEFNQLIREEEGDTLIKWQLEAFNFTPPIPGEEVDFADANTGHLHILFLNTLEPRLHRDQAGELLIILPSSGTYEYSDWQEMHQNKDAWFYALAPHNWDAGDWTYLLDDAEFFFAGEDDKLPAYDREDVLTH